MRIQFIVGARPNFIKLAALYRALAPYPALRIEIVHTGQHYDAALSGDLFRELGLPEPDFHLGVGTDTPARQLGRMLTELDATLARGRPDAVVVIGDTTSSLAGALAANRAGLPLAHVEAGLRSYDRTMPEEHNRRIIDTIADWHFVTEKSGVENLAEENITGKNVHLVGNCLIDTLVRCRPAAERLGAVGRRYTLVTLHRPSNVDAPEGLARVVALVRRAAAFGPVVWPIHPRTVAAIARSGLQAAFDGLSGVTTVGALGYTGFLNLLLHATAVVTDSGGVQEETTYLGKPCITFRANTERPVTVELGTNVLAADLDPRTAAALLGEAWAGRWKRGATPPLWDGRAAERIAAVLITVGQDCPQK